MSHHEIQLYTPLIVHATQGILNTTEYSGAQLWGEGMGGILYPFLKIEKSALILENNALILSILRLNFHSKCNFKSI